MGPSNVALARLVMAGADQLSAASMPLMELSRVEKW